MKNIKYLIILLCVWILIGGLTNLPQKFEDIFEYDISEIEKVEVSYINNSKEILNTYDKKHQFIEFLEILKQYKYISINPNEKEKENLNL